MGQLQWILTCGATQDRGARADPRDTAGAWSPDAALTGEGAALLASAAGAAGSCCRVAPSTGGSGGGIRISGGLRLFGSRRFGIEGQRRRRVCSEQGRTAALDGAVLLLRDGRNEAAWTGRIAPAMRAGWTPRGVRRNRLRLRQVGSGLGVRSCQQAAAAGVLERHSLSHTHSSIERGR